MDKESFTCEFCKTTFKTKHILKSHLIRGKKCLKQRGLKLESSFICKGCNVSLVSKSLMIPLIVFWEKITTEIKLKIERIITFFIPVFYLVQSLLFLNFCNLLLY